jgi:hypothetical protein
MRTECGGSNFSKKADVKIWSTVFLFVTVLCNGGSFLQPANAADLYHGTVVDDETGQPLSGAVVTVIWYTTPIVSMERTRSFLNAQEALTDSEGKFLLLSSPAIDWNPFTSVRKPPEVVIYKPGYAPLALASPAWKQVTKFGTIDEALKTGPIIKLPKLKTKEELRKFTSLGLLAGEAPHDKVPNLVKAANIQSKMAGLQPYPEPTDKGKTP